MYNCKKKLQLQLWDYALHVQECAAIRYSFYKCEMVSGSNNEAHVLGRAILTRFQSS